MSDKAHPHPFHRLDQIGKADLPVGESFDALRAIATRQELRRVCERLRKHQAAAN